MVRVSVRIPRSDVYQIYYIIYICMCMYMHICIYIIYEYVYAYVYIYVYVCITLYVYNFIRSSGNRIFIRLSVVVEGYTYYRTAVAVVIPGERR